RVEAEPTHPEQKNRERQPAGAELDWHLWARMVALPPFLAPDLEEDCKTGSAGGAMDNQAAGEVDHPPASQPTARVPDPSRGQVADQDEVERGIGEEGL